MDLTDITSDVAPDVDEPVTDRRRTLEPLEAGPVGDPVHRRTGEHDLRREGVSPYVWARIVVLLLAMAVAVIGALGRAEDPGLGPGDPPPSVLVQDG